MGAILTTNPFEATASALGYAFQFRYSLAHALDLFKESVEWTIAIEAGDDVDKSGPTGRELTQLKQRAPGTRLTNASIDLWKTIRIWSLALGNPNFDLATSKLFLVTTAEVSPGSVAKLLQAGDGRDEAAALSLLEETAQTSTNEANKKSYEAFMALSLADRKALLEKIEIVPKTLDIFALRKRLESAAALAVHRGHTDRFLHRLEGWWFERCLEVLDNPGSTISGVLFDEFYTETRDGFRPDQLHIDPDVVDLEPAPTAFDGRVFVQQLGLVGIAKRRLDLAIRDYLRASTQRSRWVRDQVLRVGELALYERRLRGEWEIQFARMCDDLPDTCEALEKVSAGKNLYGWAEGFLHIPIRLGCNEPFVTRGTFHHLADRKTVGWHPDFAAILADASASEDEG
jgi:hypothetical protein